MLKKYKYKLVFTDSKKRIKALGDKARLSILQENNLEIKEGTPCVGTEEVAVDAFKLIEQLRAEKTARFKYATDTLIQLCNSLFTSKTKLMYGNCLVQCEIEDVCYSREYDRLRISLYTTETKIDSDNLPWEYKRILIKIELIGEYYFVNYSLKLHMDRNPIEVHDLDDAIKLICSHISSKCDIVTS